MNVTVPRKHDRAGPLEGILDNSYARKKEESTVRESVHPRQRSLVVGGTARAHRPKKC